MPRITVPEWENIEKSIMRFKRKCNSADVLGDVKKKMEYERPTWKKKRKKKEAKNRECARKSKDNVFKKRLY